MNKRLEGRGIKINGNIKSKFGKANFICSNEHEWRTTPNLVAEGDGCPKCNAGVRKSEEINQLVKPANLCLLVHPNKPELIKVKLQFVASEQHLEEDYGNGWTIHRYRYTKESELAEDVISKDCH